MSDLTTLRAALAALTLAEEKVVARRKRAIAAEAADPFIPSAPSAEDVALAAILLAAAALLTDGVN